MLPKTRKIRSKNSKLSKVEIIELLDIDRFEKIDEWRGAYTIGIVSKPIWLTISSQQNRATDLAIMLNNSIKENTHRLTRTNQRIKIGIIGAGISGMTAALTLYAYKCSSASFSFEIDVFEKHEGICPIQRGCFTRRIHPTLQYWPNLPNFNYFSIPELLDHRLFQTLAWSPGITAGELASRISQEYIHNKTEYTKQRRAKNRLNIHEGCKYIKIKKNSSKLYDITYSGKTIKDNIGNRESTTANIKNFDIIIFATGFGIEKAHTSNGTTIESIPYWRNDSLGQFNLNDEPHRYLISGNGDGAISDALRAIIIDYKPDELLLSISDSKIESILQHAYNVTKSNKGINLSDLQNCIKYLMEKELPDISKEEKPLDSLHRLWHEVPKLPPYKNVWKHNDTPYKLISKTLIWPRAKENVEIFMHFKDGEGIDQVINNPNVTFYNKFLFYAVWAQGKISIKTGDLTEAAKKAHIKTDNIIIRHGADAKAPIKGILSDELYEKFSKRVQKIPVSSSKSIAEEIELYRKGRRITGLKI